MTLVKAKTVLWIDEAGRRVKPKTKGAKRIVMTSRKWYARLRFGKRQRWFPLHADKEIAKRMLTQLVLNKQRLELHLFDDFKEEKAKPLGEHIEAFLADLQTKGRSKKHIDGFRRQLNAIAVTVPTLGDLTLAKVDAFLQALAKEGKSNCTRNSYRQAAIALCNWLVTKERLEKNPLMGVTKAKKLSVRVRRALSVDELKRLLGIGKTRAFLYRLAIYTGLRRKELRSLKVCHFEGNCVRLPGAYTKNGKDAVLPLPEFLAKEIAKRIKGKAPESPLVSVPSRLNERWRKDLAKAKIPYRDAEGRYADFHSLRKCTATLLALANVHPRIAQQLLRHSTIELTMGVYTDASLLPMTDAVNALPTL